MAFNSTIEELAEAISAHFPLFKGSSTLQIKATLSSYPAELITRLGTIFPGDFRVTDFVASVIDDGASGSFVSEMLTFAPYLRTESTEIAKGVIKSLHRYDQLPEMADYGSASEEVQLQCRAIIVVTEALDEYHYYHGDGKLPLNYILDNKNHKDSFMLLQGEALIDLILEQPEHATTIAAIIIDRTTGDADLIREIMSQHDSKALNSGII